ncbi:PREDICTED: vinorine synthase [Theobroma cacao]|uniref:Vinorine synthase n=1 Tax=Theobroma cacao TaxID=3641 RepID=A0AB32WFW0_THECC|nr:PREDICTED: vinorine synthase [Theobroma cacao]
MEFGIVSREIIKPSSPGLHLLKPFQLSFLDQLIPNAAFVPLILFYRIKDNAHFNNLHISAKLKKSLSDTLNSLYPVSGRVKNNLFIDDFEQGVPYIEAHVGSRMSDFLQHPKLELLNQFVPFQPQESNAESIALLAIQLNVFDCGSVALGMVASHKIFDGSTLSLFLKSWVAASRGCHDNVVHPRMFEGALRFPPDESLLKKYISFAESSWFNQGKYKMMRFVFDARAIATLKGKAKSENVVNPTRIDAMTGFIWKSILAASKKASVGAYKPSMFVQAVNIREKMMPPLSSNFIGNGFLWASAVCDFANIDAELHEHVILLREAYAKTESFLNVHRVDTRLQGISEYLKSLEEISKENPEDFCFSSWLNFGFGEADFGWGKPVWVGLVGEIGAMVRSSIVFQKADWNAGGIETWITLREKEMEILENDPDFLQYASPNPSVIIPSDCL